MELDETTSSGLDYLHQVTALLQAVRNEHPTAGVWEAADYQWWWRRGRTSDDLGQRFWWDGPRCIGAATRTDWRGRTALDVIALPSCDGGTRRQMWLRGLALVADTTNVDVVVDETDTLAKQLLEAAGFCDLGERGVSAWLDAGDRPAVRPPPVGYRLVSRAEMHDRPHHLTSERNGSRVEERLRETSLYRPDLDLVVIDSADEPIAYGLFWFDAATRVGFVEPMGTNEAHRRRGLARHILTVGIDRLLSAGARRVKINWEEGNMASQGLYLDTGFRPTITTSVVTRSEPMPHP